jgi:hypothetical protein
LALGIVPFGVRKVARLPGKNVQNQTLKRHSKQTTKKAPNF